jgi:DNA modification methylase
MKTEKININKIKLNPNNPRLIKDDKFAKLVQSIKDFPEMLEIRPIVVNDDMIILGGNMRFKACKEAGLKEVSIIKASGLSEEKQREFLIKDNVSGGEWDWQLLQEWDALKLESWGLDLPAEFVTELEAEEDNFETPEGGIETDIVLGDLFEIGEHRLLCGDSTDSDSVAKLMNGQKWNLMATSPPYNQGNSCGNLLHTKGLGTGKKDVKLYQDKNSDNRSTEDYYNFCIDILNTSTIYKNENEHTVCWNVAYNAKSRNDYGMIIFSIDNPYQVKETIIWDKTHSINLPQIGIYSRRCEFVFVMSSNEKYHTSQTYNDCRWNYWQIKSAGSQITGEEVEHRAAYPIEFASNMVKDFSLQGDTIYEPFTGSGTTMVAAHQLNRKCYGMELDPKYCQVIVDRMKKLDPSLVIKRNGIDYAK